MGMQPPQPVPALVHFFTASTLVRPSLAMAAEMSPHVTLLHEQICVLSDIGSSGAPPPERAPNRSSSGETGSGAPVFASGRSVEYSAASPTRMAPSKRLPSSPTMSFL